MDAINSLSDTADINDISIGDRSVEVTGYIDQLEISKTVGTMNPTVIQRFVLNNGENRRIRCVVWGRAAVVRFQRLLRIRMILRVDGAIARSPRYDSGTNVPIELRIDENTIITDLGDYPLQPIEDEIDNPIVPLVALDDVANATGRIKVHAFLKSPFRVITGRQSSYTIGAITDGFFKLEVQRATCTPIAIERGESVEVTGIVCEVPVIHLKLRDDSEIRKRNDGERMTENELGGISKLPQKKYKRARLE